MIDHEYHELEFEITPLEPAPPAADDGEPFRGAMFGLLFALPLWIVAVLAWRFPGIRFVAFGVVKVLAVVVVFVAVLEASRRISDAWRRAHPENTLVDWLRRSGL